MSNYTDLFFEMPIKIYDGFSLRKAQKEEEETDLQEPIEANWVSGKVKFPHTEIVSWYEAFAKGKLPEDVINEGFDYTVVETKTLGDYVCIWRKEKFEAKLNEHVRFLTLNNLTVPAVEGKHTPIFSILK